MSVGRQVRHLAWCPSLSGPQFDCLCKMGTIRLTDPRPELVEAAVERYRAEERAGLPWWKRIGRRA